MQLMKMETKWVNYSIENEILYANYKKEIIIDLEGAKEMVAERLAIQNGKKYPIIIHVNGFKSPSKAARIYLATEGIKGLTMGAVIVKNAVEKIILNFFFTIEKPVIPSKSFTCEEDAVAWINEMRNKSKK